MEVKSRRDRVSIHEGHEHGCSIHLQSCRSFLLLTWSTCPPVSECCPRWHSEVLALCWDGEPRADCPPQPQLVGVAWSPVWHSWPAWLRSHHCVEMWLALLWSLSILNKEQLPAPLRMSDLRLHNQQLGASLMAQWSSLLVSKRHGFDPWVGKIPWRRTWQPTPVFLPGKSHGRRSLVGYSPCGHKESDLATKSPPISNLNVTSDQGRWEQQKWVRHQKPRFSLWATSNYLCDMHAC